VPPREFTAGRTLSLTTTELRLVIRADDYGAPLVIYRDTLGLPVAAG
jgi:hypothetical protein